MKKLWNQIVSALLISSIFVGSYMPLSKAEAESYSPVVLIDDQEISFNPSAAIQSGVFILPLKVVNKLTKVKITWDNIHKRATVHQNAKKYLISPGKNKVKTNSGFIQLEVPVQLTNGNILVPASLLEEISGAKFTLSEDRSTANFKTGSYYHVRPEGEPDPTLIPVKVDESGYVKGMKLRLMGKWYTYQDWEGLWNLRYKPVIVTADLSGDGNKEIIVINTLGYGTGLFMQEVKVVSPASGKELKVDTLESIVDEYIDSEITSDKKQVLMKLQIKGKKEITQTIKDAEFDKKARVGFGSVQSYEVKDGKLITRASATYSVGIPVGELIVTYQYKDHGFQAESLVYKPLDE